MKRTLLYITIFCFTAPWVYAQDSDQSSSDSGVLVSSPVHTPHEYLDSIKNNGEKDTEDQPDQSDQADSNKTSIDNTDDNGVTNNSGGIVEKATNLIIFQMKANLNMTPAQINAVQPIIEDNIIKVRGLQQNLEDGKIDAKGMNTQKLELTKEEYMKLSSILNPDQMKTWINIQEQE